MNRTWERWKARWRRHRALIGYLILCVGVAVAFAANTAERNARLDAEEEREVRERTADCHQDRRIILTLRELVQATENGNLHLSEAAGFDTLDPNLQAFLIGLEQPDDPDTESFADRALAILVVPECPPEAS